MSYSQDDDGSINGSDSCREALETAGLRGTFYYNGTTSAPWMAAFSAAGMRSARTWPIMT